MIETGGERFDPAEGPIYFLAVAGGNLDWAAPVCDTVLVAMDSLDAAGVERVEAFADSRPAAKVLLDSGIYGLTNAYAREHAITMDDALTLAPQEVDGFDDLVEAYVARVKAWEPFLWGYVEMDQGGADNKRVTRKLLAEEGLAPIPVYHPLLDGWDYFDELASGHDRVCFGNIVQSMRPTRMRLLATCYERLRAYPNTWVHMLGISPHQWMHTWPINSCDSSSWQAGLRWIQGAQTFTYNMVQDLDDLGWRYDYAEGPPATDDESLRTKDKALVLSAAESHMATTAWRAAKVRRAELGEGRYADDHPVHRGLDAAGA